MDIDMRFAWIPPGTFAREGKTVTISKGFYLGIYPVTQAQWKAVLGYNPSQFVGKEQRPAEMVSWFDCQDFCERLKKLTGKPIGLPTEAEWEYACRAGSNEYHTGSGEEALKKAGWYKGNSNETTHPVGQLAANAFGLYDMHGNVWGWCQDWYGDLLQSDQKDPKGPNSGDSRVLRGGSWGYVRELCRAVRRNCREPATRDNTSGCRVCFRLD